MRRLLLAGLIAAQPVRAQLPQTVGDSLIRAYKDSVLSAERRFQFAWDTLWFRSERARHSFVVIGDLVSDASPRRGAYHCHPDREIATRGAIRSNLIQNRNGYFSVCPSFDLGDVQTQGDERSRLDDALIDSLIPVAKKLRATLIATLDTAVATLLATDDLIVGQRIRFLVDQWEHEKATRAAIECRATAWWCSALAGFTLAARAQPIAAESAFAAATAAMPGKVRCAWNDHRLLIDFESRVKYAGSNCDERDALNAKLWWLADPLFIEPGNERKVEQDARSVLMMLRTALDRDERYAWKKDGDDDARQVAITRYGWPAYSFWGGFYEDRAHTGYLAAHTTQPNPPYVTYEYTGMRAHTIPAWDAIENPFRAEPGDWTITAPDAHEPATPRSLTRETHEDSLKGRRSWWPVEHFAPRRPLTQMYGGQHALLRRADGALLAVATPLNSERLVRRPTDTIPSIVLVASTGPGRVQRVTAKPGPIGATFELHGLIESSPALAGLEYSAGGGHGGPAGRLRFGIEPGPPLSSLKAGQLAISDPIILLPPRGAEALPNEIEAALRLMAPSHVLADVKKLGVYWETYGFQPTDSVELAVWIERYTPQGIGRRFGIVFGVSTDLNTPIAITWKEPQPGYRSNVFREASVPVIGRSVAIDASALPPGDYRLEVAVRKGTSEPLRGRTTFVVR